MGNEFLHDLFLELEAFDPKWQLHYSTTERAASAAGACQEWREYCRNVRHRHTMTCAPGQVIDTMEDIRRQQDAARSSSLPYKLDTIGSVRHQVDE